jgi:hypothetical protein
MLLRTRLLRLSLALVLGGLSLTLTRVFADDPAASAATEKAILLPDFPVTEKMKLRPEEKWLVGELGGFVIFSEASEKKTRDYVGQLYQFHQAFTSLFPKANVAAKNKVTLVLCDSSDKFSALAPKLRERTDQAQASCTASDDYETFMLINLDVNSLQVNTPGGTLGAMETEDGLSPDDPTAASTVDRNMLVRREYLHLILSRIQPRSPAWLEEGVALFFSSMKVNEKTITYAKLDKEFLNFFNQRALLSMPELFAVRYDSPDYQQIVGSTFSSQALAFVHYGMFGYKMRYQKAFLEFIEHATREPVTEPMFKKFFGMSYSDMEVALRGYVEGGAYRYVVAPRNLNFPPLPAFELRAATDAEMGRIKGETLRLTKRAEEARIEFISPIVRKHADARLLGALGQLDYEQQNLASARKFLEEAVAAKVDTPAPYITLAKLRLNLALTSAPQAGLNPTQLRGILTPLFAARALNQSRPEVYSLIADAWEHSLIAPTQENLAVIDEGVAANPRNHDLLYKDAALKARCGFSDDARALIEVGLKVTHDDTTHNRFEQLKASLPAVAPTAAAP